MGAVADAALAAGGEVIGVIPRRLVDRELAHPGLTELRVVETLHERKAEMAALADGFIALPGGLGHARGAGRGRVVGAARPARQADRAARCRRLLGRAARLARPRRRRGVPRAGHRALVSRSTADPRRRCLDAARLRPGPEAT